jgi:hypothetical protein
MVFIYRLQESTSKLKDGISLQPSAMYSPPPLSPPPYNDLKKEEMATVASNTLVDPLALERPRRRPYEELKKEKKMATTVAENTLVHPLLALERPPQLCKLCFTAKRQKKKLAKVRG